MSGIIRGCSMKKETKKLIAWIKKILKNCENNHSIEDSEDYLINEASAICLLDKFIEVEKQLTKGGIIQDKNGKLCKDGELIIAGKTWKKKKAEKQSSRSF